MFKTPKSSRTVQTLAELARLKAWTATVEVKRTHTLEMRCHLNIFSSSTGHKWEQKAGRGGDGVRDCHHRFLMTTQGYGIAKIKIDEVMRVYL